MSNPNHYNQYQRPPKVWLTWKEEGKRVVHKGPVSATADSQRALCGVGIPFYSTPLEELDLEEEDPEVCAECRLEDARGA